MRVKVLGYDTFSHYSLIRVPMLLTLQQNSLQSSFKTQSNQDVLTKKALVGVFNRWSYNIVVCNAL